jgi:hypothetical protein
MFPVEKQALSMKHQRIFAKKCDKPNTLAYPRLGQYHFTSDAILKRKNKV